MLTTLLILSSLLLITITALVLIFLRQRKLVSENTELKERFSAVVDADAEKKRVLGEMEAERARIQEEISRARTIHERAVINLQEQQLQLQSESRTLQSNIARLSEEFKALDEEANLQSFGFYKPRYDFANSGRFQQALERIREQQKQMIKSKAAAICRIEWQVNGSRVEGRKQTNQTLKLILRAFNGESEKFGSL